MQRLFDKDVLTALVLLCIAAVFSTGSSSDPKDWIFPQLANYVIVAIAVLLLARVVIAAVMQHLPDTLKFSSEDRHAFIDVSVFLVVVLAYMFLIFGLGFWLSSLLMLVLTSVYLTLDKTRRNIGLALIVPVVICIVAYLVFTHVFYVPFPEAHWFRGLS